MSLISDIRTAMISAIQTATGVTPTKWAGEEKALTEATAATPKISVQFAGSITGASFEIGAATYQYDPVFYVFVTTADGVSDGDLAAVVYLGQIREALNEVELAGGICRPVNDLDGKSEALIQVHGGRYLYGQSWRVEQLIS